MEWDQRAFAWLYRAFRRVAGRGAPDDSESPIDALVPRFEALTQLLTGDKWEVLPGKGMGGAAPGRLVLPRDVSWLPVPDDQAAFYLARVVIGVTAAELGLSTADDLSPIRQAVVDRYPGAAALLAHVDSIVASSFPFDRLGSPWGAPLPSRNQGQVEQAPPDDPTSTLPTGTERKMPRRPSEVEYVDIESQKDRDNPLVHSFEKVHTATEYESGRKQLDGSDQLAEHEEALEELDLKKVTRSTEAAQSIYRGDLQTALFSADLEDDLEPPRAHRYPEWNFKHRNYREDWCTVNEVPVERLLRDGVSFQLEERRLAAAVAASSKRIHGEVLRLQAELKRLALERRWRNRQLDGTEIDIDGLVDRHADLKARRHPDPRIYVRRKLHDSELAMLVLIDASLSSDSWVSGKRIFDVVRDSAQVLVESFEPTSAKLCVSAFYSNTRRDCRFIVAKSFDDPVQTGLRRLHALSPAGYTRIGPALRHSLHLMQRGLARRRLILVLTDARPTDYDHYEGRYGIEDVRQALREAREDGVHCIALAVRNRAEPLLTQMFGPHDWMLLPDASAIPSRLVSVASRFF